MRDLIEVMTRHEALVPASSRVDNSKGAVVPGGRRPSDLRVSVSAGAALPNPVVVGTEAAPSVFDVARGLLVSGSHSAPGEKRGGGSG